MRCKSKTQCVLFNLSLVNQTSLWWCKLMLGKKKTGHTQFKITCFKINFFSTFSWISSLQYTDGLRPFLLNTLVFCVVLCEYFQACRLCWSPSWRRWSRCSRSAFFCSSPSSCSPSSVWSSTAGSFITPACHLWISSVRSTHTLLTNLFHF